MRRSVLAGELLLFSVSLFIANPTNARAQMVGLFSPGPGDPVSAGMSPIAVTEGDFNGDGKPDLAIANEYTNDFRGGGSITILLNSGGGHFLPTASSPIALPFSPQTIATGDFNNDGIVDLAISNNGSTGTTGELSIFLGDGKGGFAQANGFPMPVGPGPFSLVVSDFNHDGNQDIALALFRSDQIQVLLGNGEASFVSSTFGTDAGPRALAVGDFDGDGNPDLAVANFTSNDVNVLLGDGAGGFKPAPGSPFSISSHSGLLSPIAIAVGDFNEDGDVDLAVANSGVNNVSILLGDGTGRLSATSSTSMAGSFPAWIGARDLNGDGHLDLAIANANSNNVTVLTGNGNGSFAPAMGSPFAVGIGPQALVEADLNGDGRPDLATIGFTGQTVSILLNQTCTMTVKPASLTLDVSQANSSLSIIAMNPATCNWTATTEAPWIELEGDSGTNSGYEALSITKNTTGSQRTGFILIAGTSVSVTQMATAQEFADVLPSAYYFDAVDALKQSGITSGCGAENFCPNAPVTRAEMAAFLIASILGPNGGPVPPIPFFNDVPPGSPGFAQIQQLFELGITTGCGDGRFCPSATMTRAQMAVMIIRARYGSSAQFTNLSTPFFADVLPGDFGFEFIQRMRQDGITTGCTPTTFCPNELVFRGDMAIFLERSIFNRELLAGTPYLASISTTSLSAGSTTNLVVKGVFTHFAQGTTLVNAIPGLEINSVSVGSPTLLTVNVTAASTPTTQPEAVWVTTGAEDVVLAAALTVQ